MSQTMPWRWRRFSTRELATILDLPVRRVEGFAERGFISAVSPGGGKGLRHEYGPEALVQAMILLDAQKTFGEKSPFLKILKAIAVPVAALLMEAEPDLFETDLTPYLIIKRIDDDNADGWLTVSKELMKKDVEEGSEDGSTVIVLNLREIITHLKSKA